MHGVRIGWGRKFQIRGARFEKQTEPDVVRGRNGVKEDWFPLVSWECLVRFSFLQTLTLILHSPVFAPFSLFSFFIFFLSKTPCSSLPAFSGKCTILEFCAAYAFRLFSAWTTWKRRLKIARCTKSNCFWLKVAQLYFWSGKTSGHNKAIPRIWRESDERAIYCPVWARTCPYWH